MRTQADAAKKAKAHANKKGKKVRRRRLRDSVRRRAATRDPAQAVSKRAPKKKKTYDSDEESDGYDDDSEVRPGVLSRSSENGARRSPAQDDWGAKQKKKAPAPKKAAWTGAKIHISSPLGLIRRSTGPEAQARREAGAGAQSSTEGQGCA